MTTPETSDRTLRDDFAIAALIGLLAEGRTFSAIIGVAEKANSNAATTAAELSYDFADAMMKARVVTPDPLGRDARGVTQGMRDYLAAQPRKGRR